MKLKEITFLITDEKGNHLIRFSVPGAAYWLIGMDEVIELADYNDMSVVDQQPDPNGIIEVKCFVGSCPEEFVKGIVKVGRVEREL